jgi:hypothetical protein
MYQIQEREEIKGGLTKYCSVVQLTGAEIDIAEMTQDHVAQITRSNCSVFYGCVQRPGVGQGAIEGKDRRSVYESIGSEGKSIGEQAIRYHTSGNTSRTILKSMYTIPCM